MKKLGLTVGLGLAALVAGAVLLVTMMGGAKVEAQTPFLIPAGSSLTSVAQDLEEAGHITSADGFLLSARIFGSSEPIQAGEFELGSG